MPRPEVSRGSWSLIRLGEEAGTATKFTKALWSPIGRTIIYHDDFVIREGLLPDGRQRTREKSSSVERRNDNREKHCLGNSRGCCQLAVEPPAFKLRSPFRRSEAKYSVHRTVVCWRGVATRKEPGLGLIDCFHDFRREACI